MHVQRPCLAVLPLLRPTTNVSGKSASTVYTAPTSTRPAMLYRVARPAVSERYLVESLVPLSTGLDACKARGSTHQTSKRAKPFPGRRAGPALEMQWLNNTGDVRPTPWRSFQLPTLHSLAFPRSSPRSHTCQFHRATPRVPAECHEVPPLYCAAGFLTLKH